MAVRFAQLVVDQGDVEAELTPAGALPSATELADVVDTAITATEDDD